MKKKTWQWVVASSFVLVSYLLVIWYFRDISLNDPDRFYHLALARQTVTSGLVRSLPQAADISWSKHFTDKNFLFTLLTAAAYRVGGEPAVTSLVYILGALFLVGCGVLFSRRVTPYFWAPLLLGFLLVPDFANRLVLLRPHLLALLTLVIMMGGLVHQKPWLAALGAFLFVLSYHALYVVGAVLLLAAILGWSEGLTMRRTICLGAAGMVAGLVLNPYFPKNLGMAATTMSIALNWEGLNDIDRPLENVALPIGPFLIEYGPYLAFLSLCAFLLWRKKGHWGGKLPFDLAFTFLLSIMFWFLSTITRRAAEYAIPFSCLFAAIIFGTSIFKPYRVKLLVLLCILQIPLALGFYSHGRQPTALRLFSLEAVNEIPKSAFGEKVFNCEWHNSPYLLYARPDMRFVDISDPALLFESSPKLYDLRKRLRDGEISDLYSTIGDDFHSDFVLCEKRSMIQQMERDGRFERIYPKELTLSEFATWKPFLYRLSKAHVTKVPRS